MKTKQFLHIILLLVCCSALVHGQGLTPPTLLSPRDSATSQPTALTLSWSASSGATFYHLQVSTNVNFAPLVVDDSVIAATSHFVSGLANNTQYFWRVRARNANGSSVFSSPFNFTTVVAPPPSPSLSFPPNGATGQPTSVNLSWNASTGATSYRVQVSTNASFTPPLVLDDSTIAGTSRTVSGLANNTTYYWHVLAQNAGGASAYSGAFNFTTAVAPPPVPVLISPPNGATGQPTSVNLSWNASTGATSYRLQVSTNASFAPPLVLDDSTIAGTSRTLPGLSNSTQYFWHVRAQNAGGSSAYSSAFNFTTVVAPPPVPVLVSPPNGATAQPTSVTLSWNASTGATSYRVQVSTNVSFTPPLLVDDSTIAGTSRAVSGLSNNTTYYWRVRAQNAGGVSAFSGAFSFTTVAPPLPVLSVAPRILDFGTNVVSLIFTIRNTGTGTLSWSLLDNQSWIAEAPISGNTTTETDTVTVNVSRSGLPPGPYSGIINVSSNGGNDSVTVVMSVPPPPALLITPTALDFGSALTALTFTIRNTGAGTLSWTVSDNQSWITEGPTSGSTTSETDTVTVTVIRGGLPPNTYSGTITVNSNGGNDSISVRMVVPSVPTLSVVPLSLDFGSSVTSLTIRITNTGTGTLSWTVSDNQPWISESPTSGNTTTETDTVTVTVDRGGLPSGPYSGTVTVSSNGGTTQVAVSMSVAAQIVARFFGSPTSGVVPLAVQFADSSAGPVTSWLWRFGDGSIATSRNPSHIYSTVGTYSVTLIVAGASLVDSTTRRDYINATSVAVTVSIPESTTVGSSLRVLVTLPQNFIPTTRVLYYRHAGDQSYDSLSLTQSGTTLQADIPSGYADLRGVECFVLLSDGQVIFTYPTSDPVHHPAVIRVQVATILGTLPTQRRVYTMVSVPLELSDPSPAAVLFDDYGEYRRNLWRLFRWEQDAYVEYPHIAASFQAGKAFWLITHVGAPFDVDEGFSVNSASPYQITLEHGWNQIADPFAFPVAWDSIANSNLVIGPYFYDGVEFQPNVSVLIPWQGYFVFDSTGSVVLSVPPVSASATLNRISTLNPITSSYDFVLQFSAEAVGTELKDTQNLIGFRSEAQQGLDRLDLPEPPPIGDFVQLSIVDNSQRYMWNFKPVPAEGETWDVRVRSTLSNQMVHVTMHEDGALPSGFAVFVFDLDNGVVVSQTNYAFDVQLGPVLSERNLRIVIGTEAYAAQHSDGAPLVPTEFQLEQNYPNPFNPTTTIRYQLARKTSAVLDVFNLLGQHVRTLSDREQTAGSHTVVWDGLNETGHQVSAGVYFYRLRAGDFTATRKLVLIR